MDIRVQLPSDVQINQFSSFQDAVRERYPKRRERIKFAAELEIGPQQSKNVQQQQVDGFLFESVDGKNIVQARLDGFTVNRLRPYDAWASFRETSKELWNSYLAVAKPISVTRVALRYINRLELPLPIADFREYILTTPEIAPSLPQGLKTFFMRLEIPSDTHNALAIVTETLEQPVDSRLLPLIFDIDVIRQGDFSPESEEIWTIFESLRTFKNEIFFNSITEKGKELFK